MLTDVESDEFGSARGTKQGDPLSSLIFNSDLHSAMEKDTETWNEKGFGIELGDEKRDCICNLRFAGDVLMMANSLKQFKRMMTDFKKSTEAQGLGIHPDKLQILSKEKSNIWADDHIRGSRNYRGVAQHPLCLVRVRQTSTRIDIQVSPSTTQVAPL